MNPFIFRVTQANNHKLGGGGSLRSCLSYHADEKKKDARSSLRALKRESVGPKIGGKP